MNRVLRSSAFSLAFGYVALGMLAIALFAAPLWYVWRGAVEDGRAELLQEDREKLTSVFRDEGPSGLAAFINARVGMQIAGERFLLLTDSNLHPLAGNMPAWPSDLPEAPASQTARIRIGDHQIQAVIVQATLPGGYRLFVGRDLARFAPVETRFWYGLVAALATISIVGVLGGVLIRRMLMARIHSIDRTVLAIVNGDLGHRLATRSSGDELDTLSITINRMLDQIEQLVHGVRSVSDSIAHELRTPLAELRSRLEVIYLTRPPPDEAHAEVEAAVADVDRVIQTFNALLRLAEIDTGTRRAGFVAVDASKVVREAVEFYLPATEIKGVALSYREIGPMPVSGDPLLLTQAVGNLIDNALKYARNDGQITVDLARRGDGAVSIGVTDDGPGIPDAEKPQVIRRFYRGLGSADTPGVGLGLTLVDAVARLHGGVLELADNNPGLRAQLVLRF